jgi:hypothetical protein
MLKSRLLAQQHEQEDQEANSESEATTDQEQT